jgi:hypothetical protein
MSIPHPGGQSLTVRVARRGYVWTLSLTRDTEKAAGSQIKKAFRKLTL